MQETPKVGDFIEKNNISPSQVAFIVDHYLCANNLSQTRAIFRMEASSLFAGLPLSQVSLFPPLTTPYSCHSHYEHFFNSFILFSSYPRLPLIWTKYSLIIYL